MDDFFSGRCSLSLCPSRYILTDNYADWGTDWQKSAQPPVNTIIVPNRVCNKNAALVKIRDRDVCCNAA